MKMYPDFFSLLFICLFAMAIMMWLIVVPQAATPQRKRMWTSAVWCLISFGIACLFISIEGGDDSGDFIIRIVGATVFVYRGSFEFTRFSRGYRRMT